MNRRDRHWKVCKLVLTTVLAAPGVVLLVAAVAPFFIGLISPAARLADSSERLTPEKREELKHEAIELLESASQLRQRGEIVFALEKTKQAVQICERLYPKSEYPAGHAARAGCLNEMGSLLQDQGAYAEAREYFERALAMNQALYPKEMCPHGDPDLARSLNNLGAALWADGAYVEARGYYERALAMKEALYPKEHFPQGHPGLATSLNNLGALLGHQGAYSESRGYVERALAMCQALYPKEHFPQGHPELAKSLTLLGVVLQHQGAYVEARGYFERALAMYQAVYPKERYPRGNPDVAQCLDNLGAVLQAQGSYGGARGYCERAFSMYQALYPEQRYPHGHPRLAESLTSLGFLVDAQGAHAEAQGYFERSLAMYSTLYPEEQYPHGHPELARSLRNMATVLKTQGTHAEAQEYSERALAIYQAIYPKERYPHGHPDLAASLINMGVLLQVQGADGEARGYFQRALAMYQTLYPKEQYPRGHPALSPSLNKLGELLYAEGNYREARGYFERVLAMNQGLYPKELYPQGHDDLATSLSNVGSVLYSQGVYGEARPFLQQCVDMQQRLAEILLAATSEAEALNHMAQLALTRDGFISVCLHVPGSDEALYDRLWRGKAAVARMLQRRQAELFRQAAVAPGAARDIETWREIRDELARLLLATADGRDHPERLARLQHLTADKERIERQLAATIREFARHQDMERSRYTRLVEALPEHMVILDITSYTRSEQDPQIKGEKGWRATPSYIGFVLAKRRPVRAVDLGPAAPIDEAVETWREAIKGRRASPAAAVLRRLVWEPFARRFAPETTTVVLALDGWLTAVPWAALPGDKPGTVLLEQYTLTTVPHAPFLLDRLTAPARPANARGILLAVGGVAYDQAPKPVEDEKTKPEVLALRQPETGRGRGDGWKQLPGTLNELNAVTRLADPRTVFRLEGAEAGTAQLVRELPRARWAHIATHGFFADPNIPSVLRPDPKLFGFVGNENVGVGMRNPLVLSGLVLAGGNRPSADADNSPHDDMGILTAEAIAGLPLQDLELVVLSACETGLGLVGGGEGVFGLQRAFHLAGAHNVVASLWQVDDQATAALMAIFYDQLWREHKPPIEALRTAQLAIYRNPGLAGQLAKLRGTPDFDKLVHRPEPVPGAGHDQEPKNRAPVNHWAAFVLSGWGK